MADKRGALSQLEQESAQSWLEWPIYVVIRLKRLQAIQEHLRMQGRSPSVLKRRDEFLEAVHDLDQEASDIYVRASGQYARPSAEDVAAASAVREAPAAAAAADDDYEPIDYFTDPEPTAPSPAAAASASSEDGDDDDEYYEDIDYESF